MSARCFLRAIPVSAPTRASACDSRTLRVLVTLLYSRGCEPHLLHGGRYETRSSELPMSTAVNTAQSGLSCVLWHQSSSSLLLPPIQIMISCSPRTMNTVLSDTVMNEFLISRLYADDRANTEGQSGVPTEIRYDLFPNRFGSSLRLCIIRPVFLAPRCNHRPRGENFVRGVAVTSSQ